MSFQCSIFGHKYGEAEVSRERMEDGSEVVTTVRETETCVRCGEQRVVSENKEVTTLETAADIVANDLEDKGDADGAEEEPAASEEPSESGSPTGSGDVMVPEAESQTPGVASSGTPNAAEDDGVIIDAADDADEEADDDGRKPGEWPEESDDGDDWQPAMATTDDPGPDLETTGSAVSVPDGEYRCPECSYTTPVEESSLREGDFCPECHRGALEHRP